MPQFANNAKQSMKVILCVDDEPAALALRVEVLERAGFSVLSATTGHDALALFNHHDVDLVLLEPVLTEAESATLVQSMKARKPNIPIIIYSAAVGDLPEETICADNFVTKLAPVDELLDVIRHMTSKIPGTTSNVLAPSDHVPLPRRPRKRSTASEMVKR